MWIAYFHVVGPTAHQEFYGVAYKRSGARLSLAQPKSRATSSRLYTRARRARGRVAFVGAQAAQFGCRRLLAFFGSCKSKKTSSSVSRSRVCYGALVFWSFWLEQKKTKSSVSIRALAGRLRGCAFWLRPFEHGVPLGRN